MVGIEQNAKAPTDAGNAEQIDIVIVGAGFSGMYAVHKFRKDYRVLCFEAGDGVGGTWYWNRYPGARVDIESVQYSYSFDEDLQQEWQWPELFSSQSDLEAYANHVADRFGLREHIRFSTRVNRMRYDDGENRWHVHTDRGDHVICRYVVTAAGTLDATHIPDWPGRESFKGQTYHTSKWPREGVDVAGKRVGIIGTGSTSIQAAPVLAETAGHLFVFQRTPAFSMPSGNRPLDPQYEREWKSEYRQRREAALNSPNLAFMEQPTRRTFDVTQEERDQILQEVWNSRSGFQLMSSFTDTLTDAQANEVVAEFVRQNIRRIVKDPEVAELLCPKTYPLGAKRMCVDVGYYEMYNRDNVTLVDVCSNPITKFTLDGLATTAGHYDLDIVVFATGFDAITGSLLRMNITGVDGIELRDKWRDGPTTQLGFAVAGFPNLFMVHGPQTSAALAVMIPAAEWQIDWIARALDDLQTAGYQRIEATPEGERAWAEEVEMVAAPTLFKSTDSWYTGANVDGKTRSLMIYVGGFDRFTRKCMESVEKGYEGFVRL